MKRATGASTVMRSSLILDLDSVEQQAAAWPTCKTVGGGVATPCI